MHGLERAVAASIARQYAAKYGADFDYRPPAEQYVNGPIFRAHPTKLIAFDVRRFNTSATRFTFQPAAGEENADDH